MDILKDKSKNNFTRSVFLIVGGTAFAQFINSLVSPIITRIYSPEEYGILTVYTSIIGIFSVLGSLRYEATIAIADDDRTAINMITVSTFILLINITIMMIIMYISGDKVLNLFGADNLYKYKYFIPIGLLFIGLYNIFIQWSYRNKNFKTISKTKLKQSIVQNVINIAFGIAKLGGVGLIIGKITGQSAGFITLSKPIIKYRNLIIESINFKEIMAGLVRYRNFALFSTPSQLLNIAGLQMPVFLLTAFFGNGVTGLYGLANSMINIPFSLISNAVSDVYYSEAANIGKSDPIRLKILSNQLLKKMILLGIIPTVIIMIFAPKLFSIIFGDEWYNAGIYGQLIVISVFARFIFMPISRVYEVYERQKEALVLDAIRIILVVLTFVISKLCTINSYGTVFIYSLAMSFIYMNTYIMSQKILNSEIKKISNH